MPGTPSTVPHPRLRRLDDLAAAVASSPDAVAVLGLGSAGVDRARFDDHSDIDFFLVIADAAAKRRRLADPGWLAAMGEVVFSFVNDPNGRKVLFADGLFVEYAVFTADELAGLPVAGARVVWRRPGIDTALTGAPVPRSTAPDSMDFHRNEALTNLFVGLHRELRGERLSACRFIQVFAVDRVLAMTRLSGPAADGRDPFDATRRAEARYPELVAVLPRMTAGYQDNAGAAQAVLDWLCGCSSTDPVLVTAIRELIANATRPMHSRRGERPG